MPNIEKYENLVIGSGGAGKFMAWTMAGAGRRTALVERGALGGACPNVACLPSKNIIHSAKVISLAMRGSEFGLTTESMSVDMKAVQRRKRLMVAGLHQVHVERTTASGAELITGSARFVAPRTVEIDRRSGGTRTISGDRVFLDLGSRASLPEIPGIRAAKPMTHVEALDLDRLPEHLVVLGGGINGGNRTTKNRLIPFCMFTDPELARVGKNELEARRDGIEYRLVKMPMAEILRTRTISEHRGLMKMLIAKDSDEILGFTVFGFEASELMASAQTAMVGHLPYTALRDAIFAHPTMSEGLNQLLAAVPSKSARTA